MRYAVIGATGATGQLIVEMATQSGHSVVALARRPEAIRIRHSNLEVRAADVRDSRSLQTGIAGCDAVISALGRGGLLQARKPSTVLADGAINIVTAMQATGIPRLVAISSVGVEEDPTEGIVYRLLIKPMLADMYGDMQKMEAHIQRSTLDWTLLRPPRLTNGKRRDEFHIQIGGNVPGARTLSRVDLARFAVKQANEATYSRKVVGLSYETV